MPIKAGDLSVSACGKMPTMVFDGKRDRIMWEEGGGNGDPSISVWERIQNNVGGHPTWKIFCGEVSDPIVRGKSEPPRYIYLDDQACYAVWCSRLYTNQELRAFWPFDFDHVGKIKTGRKNRGRPAYLDDSCIEYAKGVMRTKPKVYKFCGAPDFIGYTPARPTRRATRQACASEDADISTPITIPKLKTPLFPTLAFPLSPIGSPSRSSTTPPRAASSRKVLTSRDVDIGNRRILWESTEAPRGYVAGPVDGSLLPLEMAQKALQGSPYFETPASEFRSHPRPRGGDMANMNAIAKLKRKVMKKSASTQTKRRKVEGPSKVDGEME